MVKKKNIFKNKIVVYTLIGIGIIAIGIVSWGLATNWKFWNVSKSTPSPKEDYPIHHSCHISRCKKCNDSETKCEECDNGTIDITGFCSFPPQHPCDDKHCEKCDDLGKKCIQCGVYNGYKYDIDKNGACCLASNLIDGTCCNDKNNKCQNDTICCEDGSTCSHNNLAPNREKCCKYDEQLANNGDCCPTNKIDSHGNCCIVGELCGSLGNQTCCGDPGKNRCNQNSNKCELICGDLTCEGHENCIDKDDGSKACENKPCEFIGDHAHLLPRQIYSDAYSGKEDNPGCQKDSDCGNSLYGGTCMLKGSNTGQCEYYPMGIVTKNYNKLSVDAPFKEDAYGNPILFLYANGNEKITNDYNYTKIKYRKNKLGCSKIDCTNTLGTDAESEELHYKSGICIANLEEAQNTQSAGENLTCPSSVNSQRCCFTDDKLFTGQICPQGTQCSEIDPETGLGTCAPHTCIDENLTVCGNENGECKTNSNGNSNCECTDHRLNTFNCVIPKPCKTGTDSNPTLCSGKGQCLHHNTLPSCVNCDKNNAGTKCELANGKTCYPNEFRQGNLEKSCADLGASGDCRRCCEFSQHRYCIQACNGGNTCYNRCMHDRKLTPGWQWDHDPYLNKGRETAGGRWWKESDSLNCLNWTGIPI